MDGSQSREIRPDRLYRSRSLAHVAYLVAFCAYAGMILAASVPGLGGGELPFSMFAAQQKKTARIVAQVRTSGEWVDLPLERWFTYQRGMTTFRLPDEHPAMLGPRDNPKKREFARWLVERAVDLGYAPTEVRLVRSKRDVETDEATRIVVATYAVEDL